MSILFRGARFLSRSFNSINLLRFYCKVLFVYGENYNTAGDHGTIIDYYGNLTKFHCSN